MGGCWLPRGCPYYEVVNEMNYGNGLKTLRTKMLEKATGMSEPVVSSGLESFIPSRQPVQAEQPTTEDLMSKGASWLSEIKKAAVELRQAYEREQAKKPKESGVEKIVRSVSTVINDDAAQGKEAFIARRAETSPSTFAPQRPGESTIPLDAEVSNVLDAIAAVESRGSGDYAAVGPVVEKGAYKGQRAYGRYQVMEGNIAPWTEAALGRSMSVEEFRADKNAQDAVAAHQLRMSKDKYGTWEDAASVWFSGRPMKSAGNASDGFITVPEYISKFRRNFVRST